jgi:hypothetical protein
MRTTGPASKMRAPRPARRARSPAPRGAGGKAARAGAASAGEAPATTARRMRGNAGRSPGAWQRRPHGGCAATRAALTHSERSRRLVRMRSPRSRLLLLLTWAAAALLLAGACASHSPPAEPAAELRDQRIEELHAAIRWERERLKELITRQPGPDDPPLREDPELRAVSARLLDLQAELRELERERDAAATTP